MPSSEAAYGPDSLKVATSMFKSKWIKPRSDSSVNISWFSPEVRVWKQINILIFSCSQLAPAVIKSPVSFSLPPSSLKILTNSAYYYPLSKKVKVSAASNLKSSEKVSKMTSKVSTVKLLQK